MGDCPLPQMMSSPVRVWSRGIAERACIREVAPLESLFKGI
jgi:hypothetical protein